MTTRMLGLAGAAAPGDALGRSGATCRALGLHLACDQEQFIRVGVSRRGDVYKRQVLKAYRELEHRGLAAGRPGQGTFVEGTLAKVGLPEQTELRRALLGWLRMADTAGLDEAGMIALFTSALRDFHDRRDSRRGDGGGPIASRSRRSRRGSGRDGAEGVA